jgi:hypothetical protein
MQFSELIIESREDDFKKKYSKKFSAQNLEKIVKSIAPKYLDWVGKVMDEINFDETFSKVVPTVTRFNNISTNLPQTDINQYKSFNELYDSITKYDSRIRRDVKQVKGGNVVYDDGVFFVVNPLNYESSCYYGKGTKWCTAAETDSHFKRYNEDGKLFYIIDRTKASNDPNYKIAMLKKFDGDISFFDAKDDRVDAKNVFGEKKYNEIMTSADEFLNEVSPEQVKIYADKAAAKKEKEGNIKIEKARYDNIVATKQKEIENVKEKYDKLVNEQNLYNEKSRLLQKNNQTELVNLLKIYEPEWQNQGQTFAEKFLFGLNSKKQDIKEAVAGIMGSIAEVTSTTATAIADVIKPIEDTWTNTISQMKQNSDSWANAEKQIVELKKQLQLKKNDTALQTNIKELEKLQTGLSDKNLTMGGTLGLERIAGEWYLPDGNKAYQGLATNAGGGGVMPKENNFNITINDPKFNSKNEVDKVMNQVVSRLKQLGVNPA